MRHRGQWTILAIGAVLISLAGCLSSAKQTRYYLLSTLDTGAEAASAADIRQRGIVGLTAVEVPSYLDHPQIAARHEANQVKLAEFDRWAEPLQDGVSRAIAANLRAMLPDRQVVQVSQSRLTADLRVIVAIQRLDGALGEGVTLDATWLVRRPSADDELASGTVHRTVPLASSDYAAYVEGQSKLLEALCRELSSAIERTSP